VLTGAVGAAVVVGGIDVGIGVGGGGAGVGFGDTSVGIGGTDVGAGVTCAPHPTSKVTIKTPERTAKIFATRYVLILFVPPYVRPTKKTKPQNFVLTRMDC